MRSRWTYRKSGRRRSLTGNDPDGFLAGHYHISYLINYLLLISYN